MNDAELIELWHSRQPNSEIAMMLGVTVETVQRLWQGLRDEGKVPDIKRSMLGDEVHAYVPNPDHDGRPSVGFYNDPLLSKLWEVHGKENRGQRVEP